jgi:hypothetical protein
VSDKVPTARTVGELIEILSTIDPSRSVCMIVNCSSESASWTNDSNGVEVHDLGGEIRLEPA